MKTSVFGVGALGMAFRTVAFVCAAFALANCGDGAGYDDGPDDPLQPIFTIDLIAQTPGNFGAIQLDIKHLGIGGGFVGRGDKVDCVPLVEAIVASNYLGERETKIGMISLQGIETPADLMRCRFRSFHDVDASDFEIEVTDASDTSSNQVDPPVIAVRVTPGF